MTGAEKQRCYYAEYDAEPPRRGGKSDTRVGPTVESDGSMQLPQTDLHVTVWGEGEPVVMVHGSFTADPASDDWIEQRPLSDRYQMIMPSRRGYFQSPPAEQGNFEVDADDIAQLLSGIENGAHLVAHSYGSLAAMLAAAQRPEAIRSLAVIEPPAFGVARGNPDVEAIIARLEPVFAAAPSLTPEAYLLSFRRALRGLPPDAPLELTEDERRELESPPARQGVEATMRERRPWEAIIPFEPLASAPFPKLVFSGGWSKAFDAVCDVLEQRLHAERAVCVGAGHAVQFVGQPFNERLVAFLGAIPPRPSSAS